MDSCAHVPGEIPGWAGTEVRDATGVVLGRIASLRFDPWTSQPTEVVVAPAAGPPVVLSARRMRVRVDHVALAVRADVPAGTPALAA